MTQQQKEQTEELFNRLDYGYSFGGYLEGVTEHDEDAKEKVDSKENMRRLIYGLIKSSEHSMIDKVREFYTTFGQPIDKGLNYNRAQLRRRLLHEEVDELDSALHGHDDVESLDAIVDCMYILIGTAIELGIDHLIPAAFAEVHRSNMTKLDANGKPVFREDGKIAKSEFYEKPNLKQLFTNV